MEKSVSQSLEGCITEVEIDSKLLSLLNSPIMLKEFFISQGLPWKQEDLEEELTVESGAKTEPTTPTTCCQLSFEEPEQPGEDFIRVGFPDLKPVYYKTQSRANRLSRQKVTNGKIKIRVITLGPQVQTIEAYVERTPNAAVLFGDKCGRVRLKSQPGKFHSNQYFFTVDLESVYESHTKPGVPVYKLSTVDSERRNKFRLVVVVVLIDNARSKEFVSRPFLLRSRTSASKTAGRFRSLSV